MDEMSFCGHSLKHHCLRLRLLIFENINDTVNDGFYVPLKKACRLVEGLRYFKYTPLLKKSEYWIL